MKPGQWAVAAVLLAAMVFAVTFAMNYLGAPPERHGGLGPGGTRPNDPPAGGGDQRDLAFISSKVSPIIEDETRASSYRDFWFYSEADTPVVVGLQKLTCRCSAVEVSVLPPDARPLEASAASCVAARTAGPLVGMGSFFLALSTFGAAKGVTTAELLHKNNSFSVPVGAVGWLRLRWKGEKVGPQELSPELWLHNKATGPLHTFTVRVVHHEPIRTSRSLRIGVVNDADLARGVTRHIYVWSSTREAFKLRAEATPRQGGSAGSDPFEVGTPQPLNEEELGKLEKGNNDPEAIGVESNPRGRVLSGYKVPVTLRAASADKVACDIGPFRRSVKLVCPEVEGEPIIVDVTGRVRGLVELGIDDEGGTIDFGPFPRRDGTRAAALQLQSGVEGIKLEFDRQRTPAYLAAVLKGPAKAGEARQSWVLQAQVLKNKASGHFPRAEDPLYEDSAIYLKATVPGQPPRSIRIAARGTANES